MFAAGVTRTADADATIAVHSAGVPGQADVDQKLIENGGTLAATILMARMMSSFGAPASIVGKMVVTPTEEAALLTRADLEAWNVRITRFASGEEKPQVDELAARTKCPADGSVPISNSANASERATPDDMVKQRASHRRDIRSPGLGRQGCLPS